jgi:hypothetical protein
MLANSTQQAVAGRLDDAALVLLDFLIDQLSAKRFEAFEGTFRVGAHKARIAHHIGSQDRGKTAGRRHRSCVAVQPPHRSDKTIAASGHRLNAGASDIFAQVKAASGLASSTVSAPDDLPDLLPLDHLPRARSMGRSQRAVRPTGRELPAWLPEQGAAAAVEARRANSKNISRFPHTHVPR